MEASAGVLKDLVESPFPGLHAFEIEESILFFGRETHTEELLRRLSENRFLAVVGASGCGKSSLVRAGLLAGLQRGYLVRSTSRWRFAILRPGQAPIDALAAALAKSVGRDWQDARSIREALTATSGGLVQVGRGFGLASGENLLVVVDQFEEIFRFAPGRGDRESQAPLFVSLLLHAVESNAPIYVTLTMRSDYQGDCAQFPGLPEALNRSQYLVPRLTRDQRREAIVRPLELAGTGATERLVNRLLNDAGDDPDHLPVLQHALLQTYRHWRKAGGRDDLDLHDYDAIGGITDALNRHGEEVLTGFTAEDRELAEKVFRCLCVRERGRDVRRPQEICSLYQLVGAGDEPARRSVDAIVSAFAQREHSLLLLSPPALAAGTVVDITHESLMRKWPRLAGWIKEERRSAEWYGDLARDVGRHSEGSAGLWRDPELAELLKRHDREGWNAAWARQYSEPDSPQFGDIEAFLDASVQAQREERRLEEAQRRKDVEQAQMLARARRRQSISLLLLLVTLVLAVAAVYFLQRRAAVQAALSDLKYAVLQRASSLAQAQAIGASAKSVMTKWQLSNADGAEKQRLMEQLAQQEIARVKAEQIVDSYQAQLNKLRNQGDLANSDHAALLKRIQDLQDNLNNVTAERDQLQQSAIARELAAHESQEKLAAVTAERDRLQQSAKTLELAWHESQAKLATRTRPVFLLLPWYSVMRLSAMPFDNDVAIAVRILHRSGAYIRVYTWTKSSSAKSPLPVAFIGDEKRARELLGPLDDQACKYNSVEGRWCYELQRDDVLKGNTLAGVFFFGGTRYEIRATIGENDFAYNHPVSLTVYPAEQSKVTTDSDRR